jgi:integrase
MLYQKPIKQPQSKVTVTVSHRGFEFDYLDDRWQLDRNVNLNAIFLDSFDISCADDIREALVYFAENYSATHTRNITDNLKLYLKESGATNFSELGLLTFKGKLKKDKEYKLAVVRGFIRQMRYLKLDSSIKDGVYELMNKWRLSGNTKGASVLSLDPLTGPFSDIEFEAIGSQSAHKYAEGKLTSEPYALILLFKATARRPEQVASLKVKDFVYSTKYTSKKIYVIKIPRIKQRGGKFRSSFKDVGLVDYIGQVITEHIKEHIVKIEQALGRKLTHAQKGELPLFIDSSGLELLIATPKDDLIEHLRTELPHMTSGNMSKTLIKAVDKLKITSERTGQRIHVTPYRFRYTLGTRAAREGAGTLTIATLLDHSDTQNVGIYIENVPEFALEISKIMNQSLAVYASAFAGNVIKDENDANKEIPGAARIPCHEKDCDIGSCGTNSFCTDYAPIACYLCPKFRPWSDAPHHLVLQWLMEERERLKEELGTIDMTIIAINDRAIIAVCQVIKLCKEYNENV